MLSAIRIVLVNTSHPGNIGAVARAMKNMCLEQLYLVQPKIFPCDEATARASGAVDILDNAVICDSLESAVADCHLVIGTSARSRTVQWPVLTPEESARLTVSQAGKQPVAIVMGRERSGLTNDELDLCQYLVHIPSNPEYNSLNIAMAVQVLSYEILKLSEAKLPSEQNRRESVSSESMLHFFAHFEQTLVDINFIDKRQSEKLMRRLKRLFYRAEPDQDELNILRGILSAAQGRKSMRQDASSEQEN